MSWLPNAAEAQIDATKIQDYLLNAGNPQNGGKAIRFTQYGFNRANWQSLAAALQGHPLANPVASETTSAHGTKYVVACNLQSPDQRNPCRTSVWIIENGSNILRFVTAY